MKLDSAPVLSLRLCVCILHVHLGRFGADGFSEIVLLRALDDRAPAEELVAAAVATLQAAEAAMTRGLDDFGSRLFLVRSPTCT